MDEFEQTLSKVIEYLVTLQRWHVDATASRHPTKIFPVILDLDSGLKELKRAGSAHPLHELAGEVRTAFDTRAFRAIRLAAFNWRSAARPHFAPPSPKSVHQSYPLQAPESPRKSPLQPPTSKKTTREANTDKFVRDFMAFFDSIPASTLRMLRSPDHVDMYRAGRRLPGHYGANQ